MILFFLCPNQRSRAREETKGEENPALTKFKTARNRVLVLMDWIKAKTFGRDVSRE
jgi:hypothetical protein